jgi:hypothetical protein
MRWPSIGWGGRAPNTAAPEPHENCSELARALEADLGGLGSRESRLVLFARAMLGAQAEPLLEGLAASQRPIARASLHELQSLPSGRLHALLVATFGPRSGSERRLGALPSQVGPMLRREIRLATEERRAGSAICQEIHRAGRAVGEGEEDSGPARRALARRLVREALD